MGLTKVAKPVSVSFCLFSKNSTLSSSLVISGWSMSYWFNLILRTLQVWALVLDSRPLTPASDPVLRFCRESFPLRGRARLPCDSVHAQGAPSSRCSGLIYNLVSQRSQSKFPPSCTKFGDPTRPPVTLQGHLMVGSWRAKDPDLSLDLHSPRPCLPGPVMFSVIL